MKSVARFALLAFLALPAVLRAAELINPGFEEGSGDGFHTHAIRGWFLFGSNVQSVTESPRGGVRCVKVLGTSELDEFYSGVFQDFPVEPGQRVKAGMYMQQRTDNPLHGDTTALAKLEFYDAQTNFVEAIEADDRLDARSARDQWIFSQARGKAPTNAAIGRIVGIFVQRFDGTPGVAYFDDASVSAEGP